MMTDERPGSAMVEVGDIDDDAPVAGPVPPPQVVIEYRDRGVPWMLIPPLLAATVAIAVAATVSLEAKWNHRRPVAVAAPVVGSGGEPDAPPIPVATAGDEGHVLPPSLIPDPKIVENPPALPGPTETPAPAPDVPSVAAATPPQTPAAVETEAPVAVVPEAPPAPKVALGFDPAAFLNPPADPPAPPMDPNLAVVQTDRPQGPAPTALGPDQPTEVDPKLLRVDPRQAQFERQQRERADRRKLEAERARFHTEVAAIIKRLGRLAGPAIHELCQTYDQEIPVAAVNQAKKELGRTGMYAGADTSVRIALLRRLGFPEPAILDDIFAIETRYDQLPEGKSRNMPNDDEMFVRSALLLLRHPPMRSATASRAAAAASTRARAAATTTNDPPDADQ